MSAPARAYHGLRSKRSERDYKALVRARGYGNAPDFHNGMPTDAFKARAVADGIRTRLNKKRK